MTEPSCERMKQGVGAISFCIISNGIVVRTRCASIGSADGAGSVRSPPICTRASSLSAWCSNRECEELLGKER
jgi:hypothetical protein